MRDRIARPDLGACLYGLRSVRGDSPAVHEREHPSRYTSRSRGDENGIQARGVSSIPRAIAFACKAKNRKPFRALGAMGATDPTPAVFSLSARRTGSD